MPALLLALVLALAPATSLADAQVAPDPLAGPWNVSVGAAAAKARSVRLPYVANATGFTGTRGIKSYANPNAVVYDVKHVLPKGESDERL